MDDELVALGAWAASGAMALTGRPDGPPLPQPAAIAGAMIGLAGELASWTARWGHRVEVDGPALLGERAAFTAMTRQGSVSVGGAARFVPVADGWVVLNLPRPDDVAALPALVGASLSPDDWPAIARRLRSASVDEVVETGILLGLAVAPVGVPPAAEEPVRLLHEGAPRQPVGRPLVIDLTSLWAGPLAASLLGAAGARVVKVEGRARPDGARRGPAPFFDLLNTGKECLSIDLDSSDDRRLLHRLLAAADLVVEGSRPRVMEAAGVDPARLADRGVSWLSITAHGREGEAGRRIGFGDDAAVAGGLWLDDATGPPLFVADAVADPIAGLAAAAAGAAQLAGPRALVMEAPLARAAAWAAGPPVRAGVRSGPRGWMVDIGGEPVPVAMPHHRRVDGRAAAPGAHDRQLREEFAGPAETGSADPGSADTGLADTEAVGEPR